MNIFERFKLSNKWYTNEVIRKGVRRQKEWKEMDLSPETSAS